MTHSEQPIQFLQNQEKFWEASRAPWGTELLRLQPVVLVRYCCVTKHHALGSIKPQQSFIICSHSSRGWVGSAGWFLFGVPPGVTFRWRCRGSHAKAFPTCANGAWARDAHAAGAPQGFLSSPRSLSTWHLQLGIFRGLGLLIRPFMAPKACMLREREEGGGCSAFLTQLWESLLYSTRTFKRPTQTPGVMTWAPFLDGGITKFWDGHVGLKILSWPFWENTICHKTFDRFWGAWRSPADIWVTIRKKQNYFLFFFCLKAKY